MATGTIGKPITLDRDYGTYASVLLAAQAIDSATSDTHTVIGVAQVTGAGKYLFIGYRNSANFAVYLAYSYGSSSLKFLTKGGGNWTEKSIVAS